MSSPEGTDSEPASAANIYARVKSEFDELERDATAHRDWVRFASTVLEAVMQCQAIVIENQRAVLEQARTPLPTTDIAQLRAQAKDALFYIDKLTELYARIKTKVTP